MGNNAAHNPIVTLAADRATADVSFAVEAVSSAFASGGDAALGFVSDATTVTIRTDGTHDFGSVGPELVALFDATLTTEAGDVAPILGPNTVSDDGNLPVQNIPEMPGGVGYAMTRSRGGFQVNTTPHTRGFESRTYYWPAANRIGANAYLLDPATDGDNKDWQIKPVWNMADGNFGGDDTNFFMVTWEKLYHINGGGSWKQNTLLSTNSLATIYGPSLVVQNTAPISDEPLNEPYTTEFLYDQVDIDAPGQAFYETFTRSPSIASHYGQEIKSGLTLHEPTGNTRLINRFSYPGYLRGFSYSNSWNTVEGEMYKAAGPGAACRIVIANSSTLDTATKTTILEVTSWTSSQVTAKLRGGWWNLADLSGKYFCVVGTDNRQIGTGVQI